jgi:type IX secretion system PorP/SprF family membrane protein
MKTINCNLFNFNLMSTKRRIPSIFLFLTLFVMHSAAQQQPLYSQFTFNKFLFNPAVAGSDNLTVIKVSAYEQWTGFKGAPKFHTASFDTRIFQENRKPRVNIRKKFKLFKPGTVGVGVQLFNEKYGPLSNTGLSATYSYHIKLGSRQLSLGISSVISNMGLKSSDIVLSDEIDDMAVLGDNTRRWITDFNFGIYFLDQNYFAGYSIHHLSRSAIQWGGTSETDYMIGRQHYLMGGYRFAIADDYQLIPSALFKISEVGKSQMDINVQCTIKENYWCGLTYKTSKALSIFGGLQYDRYSIGYSFDYHLSDIRKANYGSHEILLAVQLGEMTRRYKWLNTY